MSADHEPAEAWALDAARHGESFGALCAGLCQWVGEAQAAAHAASLLRTWIVEGLVTAVLHPSEAGQVVK
ncbi:MAG: hypothetical protein WA970_21745 [Gammaproteobacteria bacterium]